MTLLNCAMYTQKVHLLLTYMLSQPFPIKNYLIVTIYLLKSTTEIAIQINKIF